MMINCRCWEKASSLLYRNVRNNQRFLPLTFSTIVASRFSTERAKTDFGFQDVNKEEKEHLVKEIFSKVAAKYDIMNDFMSLGAHRLWKDELLRIIDFPVAAKSKPSYVPRHLDVAGGTGDVAFRSLTALSSLYQSVLQREIKIAGDDTIDNVARQVVVCDINPQMLAVGRDRADKIFEGTERNLIGFVEGNAEVLPFADNSFDLYTIAFGLRNVTNKDIAIKEAFRVLKKGGRMMILEFSHVENPLLAQVYDQYSFQVIPKVGELIAGDAESYQYLVESIRRFPKQAELSAMMADAGFRFVTYTNLTFGVVAVHSGFKL